MGTISAVAGDECGPLEDLPGAESRVGRSQTGEDDVESEVGETIEWGIVSELGVA